MAQVKNALIRQRVIDRCLRSPKLYSVKDMMEKCNIALEQAGYRPVTSKVTIWHGICCIISKPILSTAKTIYYGS